MKSFHVSGKTGHDPGIARVMRGGPGESIIRTQVYRRDGVDHPKEIQAQRDPEQTREPGTSEKGGRKGASHLEGTAVKPTKRLFHGRRCDRLSSTEDG